MIKFEIILANCPIEKNTLNAIKIMTFLLKYQDFLMYY